MRLERRLHDRGRLEFGWSDEWPAIEGFLALEGRSWKGVRGTALTAGGKQGAFAREMLAAFSTRRQLRIAQLSFDGRTIAAGAVLRSGARAHYWKTAYDATFAQHSPGVQLTLAMSRDFEADPTLSVVDSCANPGHPIIDRIWTPRIELADFVLATRTGKNAALSLAISARSARALARERLKKSHQRVAVVWR